MVVPPGGTTGGETGSNGVATFTILDTLAETVTFTVEDTTDNMTVVTQDPVAVEFTAGTVDGNESAVAANPTAVAADARLGTITVTLNDHFGNNVAGITVSLSQGSAHSVITPPTAVTNSQGVATFSVTDTTDELVAYTATDVTDSLLITQTAQVTFGTPPPVPPVSGASVIVSNYSIVPADGKTAATLTVLLYDANGLPVAARRVSVSASGGSSIVTAVSSTTNASGGAPFQRH